MTIHRKRILLERMVIVSCFSIEFLWAFASIAFGIPFSVYSIFSVAGVVVPAVAGFK